MNAMMALQNPFNTVYPDAQTAAAQAPVPGSECSFPASFRGPDTPLIVRRSAGYMPLWRTASAGLAPPDDDKGSIYLERPSRDSKPSYGLIAKARAGIVHDGCGS